ncbi:MAG: hypothetical protein Q9159_001072 [Coniocarpon cinnabarinum]
MAPKKSKVGEETDFRHAAAFRKHMNASHPDVDDNGHPLQSAAYEPPKPSSHLIAEAQKLGRRLTPHLPTRSSADDTTGAPAAAASTGTHTQETGQSSEGLAQSSTSAPHEGAPGHSHLGLHMPHHAQAQPPEQNQKPQNTGSSQESQNAGGEQGSRVYGVSAHDKPSGPRNIFS